jgi:hypothetical protein
MEAFVFFLLLFAQLRVFQERKCKGGRQCRSSQEVAQTNPCCTRRAASSRGSAGGIAGRAGVEFPVKVKAVSAALGGLVGAAADRIPGA